jgi:hypothetical protein
VVERHRLDPGPAQQRDVLLGAAIAGLMVGPVAVLGLIGVAAAGDDVHRQTAVAELVQRGQLAGGDRRRHEPRSMRQQEPQPLGHRRGVRPDEEPVRRIREVADQHAVEAGPLENARRLGNHLGIKKRSGRRDPQRHGEAGGLASVENGGDGVGEISPISALAVLRSAVANPSVNRS